MVEITINLHVSHFNNNIENGRKKELFTSEFQKFYFLLEVLAYTCTLSSSSSSPSKSSCTLWASSEITLLSYWIPNERCLVCVRF
jgi:hypothetical protein